MARKALVATIDLPKKKVKYLQVYYKQGRRWLKVKLAKRG